MDNIYQRVTDTIISQIERGAGKFRMPWHDALVIPHNAIRRNLYHGVNVIYLWAIAKAQGYPTPEWATATQWRGRGHSIIRGEKPTQVIYCNLDETDSDVAFRSWSVFNAAQVRGWKSVIPMLSETERMQKVDHFFAKLKARTVEGKRAGYRRDFDLIIMPPFSAFIDSTAYYSTLGHEHIHWTGHKSRLKRLQRTDFGSREYAFEELIAELGAAFLCAKLHIENTPRVDHAAYVADWLSVLKNDNRAIFRAASKAQKAVDWMSKRTLVKRKAA
jgi:antirestriction protein ArdC